MAPGDRGAGSVMRKSPLIAVLLGAACTGVGGSDSAGDGFAPNRIVEPVGPEQRLSLVEELRIGRLTGGDEAELLDVIKGVEIGPGGDIYVLDADEVKVFPPAGEFLRSWGRRGEGPGDFDGTLGLALARDTVAVTGGERVQFFDLGGRLLSSVWTGGRTSGYSASRIRSTDLGWVVEARPRRIRLDRRVRSDVRREVPCGGLPRSGIARRGQGRSNGAPPTASARATTSADEPAISL